MNAVTMERRGECTARIEQCRGLGGARPDEWLVAAGMRGLPTVYGSLDMPDDGELMVAKFTDGRRWSGYMVVQELSFGLYYNPVGDGTVFEWDPENVLVYSGVSRFGGQFQVEAGGKVYDFGSE